MDLFQQEIPCFEYWAYLNRGFNLRMLDSMGNGQPGLISMEDISGESNLYFNGKS